MNPPPYLDRKFVLQILHDAFDRCANYDYAWGYILHEADLRASVYGYTRAILDMSPDWRVFCDISCSEIKPDLIFFRSSDGHDENETVEILVEIKHWPTERQIRNDIKKLIKLKKKFERQRLPPTLVFIAILGNKIDKIGDGKPDELERKFRKNDVKIWFRRHRDLYCGPWNKSENSDPWHHYLKSISKASRAR